MTYFNCITLPVCKKQTTTKFYRETNGQHVFYIKTKTKLVTMKIIYDFIVFIENRVFLNENILFPHPNLLFRTRVVAIDNLDGQPNIYKRSMALSRTYYPQSEQVNISCNKIDPVNINTNIVVENNDGISKIQRKSLSIFLLFFSCLHFENVLLTFIHTCPELVELLYFVYSRNEIFC